MKVSECYTFELAIITRSRYRQRENYHCFLTPCPGNLRDEPTLLRLILLFVLPGTTIITPNYGSYCENNSPFCTTKRWRPTECSFRPCRGHAPPSPPGSASSPRPTRNSPRSPSPTRSRSPLRRPISSTSPPTNRGCRTTTNLPADCLSTYKRVLRKYHEPQNSSRKKVEEIYTTENWRRSLGGRRTESAPSQSYRYWTHHSSTSS